MNSNQPAFPGIDGDEGHGNMTGREGPNGYIWTRLNPGMTMRQYYKAAALQSLAGPPITDLLAQARIGKKEIEESIDATAVVCGAIADALLAEDQEFEKKNL